MRNLDREEGYYWLIIDEGEGWEVGKWDAYWRDWIVDRCSREQKDEDIHFVGSRISEPKLSKKEK